MNQEQLGVGGPTQGKSPADSAGPSGWEGSCERTSISSPQGGQGRRKTRLSEVVVQQVLCPTVTVGKDMMVPHTRAC